MNIILYLALVYLSQYAYLFEYVHLVFVLVHCFPVSNAWSTPEFLYPCPILFQFSSFFMSILLKDNFFPIEFQIFLFLGENIGILDGEMFSNL